MTKRKKNIPPNRKPGEIVFMKKHFAFKIMLPLIVIFILTVTVNVSTTSQFQSFREVCEGMSNTTTEVPQEIRDTAGSMAEGITA